jgi:membrane protease YdiL (CAAX protease family)
MHPVDHLFVLMLVMVQPIYGVIEARWQEARAQAGEPLNRIRFYRQTQVMEWTFAACLGCAWFLLARPVEDLGLVRPGGTRFWIGTVLLLLLTVVLTHSWWTATKTSAADKAGQVHALGKLVRYVPQTAGELRSFIAVSMTAGIVEEIVYRGFLIWYFEQYMPLWSAVVASSIAFTLGHGYQGVSGAIRCGLLGLAFALYYVFTGSIWLPIIAHALLDALQGAALYELLRNDRDELNPQAA